MCHELTSLAMILMQSRPNAKHKQTTKKKSNLRRLSDELQLSGSAQPSNSMLLLSSASALASAAIVIDEKQHTANIYRMVIGNFICNPLSAYRILPIGI